MQTERVELYFQQGSSDKVYHLQLENVEEQWSVLAQWGRRGSALQSDTKASSVAYEFRRAKEKGECPTTKPAILVDGRNAGTVFHICQDDKCPVHMRVSRYQPTPQERALRAKELLAERVEKQSRVRILEAIRKRLPNAISRPDLQMAALDYFRHLGHDTHRHLCKVYRWEEKKTKASWGAQIVDNEKIAASAVQAMSTADLNRFLVVCALVPDLCCSGYNPRQSLAKDSNLASTAVRYKIGSARIAAAVRADLSKSKDKVKHQGQSLKKLTNVQQHRTSTQKGSK